MTTAVEVPTAAPSVSRRTGTGSLTGTGLLLRFAIRRDRVRLAVWTGAIVLLYVTSLGEYAVLADDPQAMQARAALMRTPAMIAMAGPGYGLDDYTVGAAVANELILWMVLTLAVMSILQVVRGTRAEEESGRAELVRAGIVGRHAASVAAMAQVLIANVVIAVVTGAVLVGFGLDAVDSFAMTFGVAGGALVFAAVALVAAQLAEHARGATGMAFAVLGAAYVLRAVGDIQAEHGSILSWLSPIGWVQQLRAFVDLNPWPFALCVGAIAGLLWLAAVLASRRDFGAGMVAVRPGRADAAASLRGPLALAWRQQRSSLAWTALGLGLMWVATGGVLNAVPDMVDSLSDNPVYSALLSDGTDLVSAFIGIIGLYAAAGAAGFAVAGSLRAKGEEESGRAEYALATPTGRVRWLGANLAVAAIGAAVVLLTGIVALWAGAAATGMTDPGLGDYLGLGLLYLPALAVVVGFAGVLYAWVPRATGLAWALFAYMFVVGMFADLVRLPDWARGVSPFWWVRNPMLEDVSVARVLGLCAVAVVLVVAALAGFRRRDVPRV